GDGYRHRQAETHQLHLAQVGEDGHHEDQHHDQGAGGDQPGGDGQAGGDGVGVVTGGVPLLLARREQEDLVVHGEAEHDGEEHHRRPGLDRPAVDTHDRSTPAPLEHRHHHAVGGADREQVHDDGLERHDDRPEDHEQQQEAEQQDGTDEDREPVAD